MPLWQPWLKHGWLIVLDGMLNHIQLFCFFKLLDLYATVTMYTDRDMQSKGTKCFLKIAVTSNACLKCISFKC